MDVFSRRGVAAKQEAAARAFVDNLEKGRKKRDPAFLEVERICRLPVLSPPTEEEIEEFCRQNVLVEAFNRKPKPFRLKPAQVAALLSYDLYDGGFFPVQVGGGKSLISLMIAERFYRRYPNKKCLLLIPPQVEPQLMQRALFWARKQVPLSVPIVSLARVSAPKRQTLALAPNFRLYVMPYSLLSRPDGATIIGLIEPGLIIADEAHRLKNATTGRTKVVRHYIDKHKPQMVAMSGTMTNKSILDYWHIISACMKDRSPLPLSANVARQWAQVLDAENSSARHLDEWGEFQPGAAPTEARTEPIMPLVVWSQKRWPEDELKLDVRGFRRAYKRRLTTAPGVVVSFESDIGTSLIISNTPCPYKPSQNLLDLIERVQKEFVAPNGDEIDHAMHCWRWLYELSAGFYNDLYWPTAEVWAAKNGTSLGEAEDKLGAAKDHHKLHQIYRSTLRRWLNRGPRIGLHLPMMVAEDMARNGPRNVGDELYETWRAAKDAEFAGMPKRWSRAIFLDDYKIRQVVDWATSLKRGTGAVIWVDNIELGEWLVQHLEKTDLPVLHCPAGDPHNSRIIDPENGDRIIVASIKGHGEGKELQHFQEQFVVQWPRSEQTAEQVLGRLHREGQVADELVVNLNNTLPQDIANFAACLNDSVYVQDTMSTPRKLLYAVYDPQPIVLDVGFLRSQGLDPKMLTGEQVALLKERFGDFGRLAA